MQKSDKTRCWAVIPAAGVGARMQADRPKQYLEVAGKSILEHTLRSFDKHPEIQGIMLVISEDDAYWPDLDVQLDTPLYIAPGGEERCHSVLSGLSALQSHAKPSDWVLVHDAARPCLRQSDLSKLIDTLNDHPVGGLLALPVRDTLKRGGKNDAVEETVNRDQLWHALTPQMFRLADLHQALSDVIANDRIVTDEAQAIEMMGRSPRLVEGYPDNVKVTRPFDLALATQFLLSQESDNET